MQTTSFASRVGRVRSAQLRHRRLAWSSSLCLVLPRCSVVVTDSRVTKVHQLTDCHLVFSVTQVTFA